jgi:hypothetical protein
MVTVTTRRKVWGAARKFKAKRKIENGKKKKADVCRVFGLVNCIVQRIWENRIEGVSVFEQNGVRIERFGKPERSDVGEALLNLSKRQTRDSVGTNTRQCTNTRQYTKT